MKIYTKTGDDGDTGLFGGPRVRKDHPRIEAYGTVDELNAVLGLARTQSLPTDVDVLLERVQNELFDLGAELATPEPTKFGMTAIGDEQSSRLETAIDQYEAELEPLKQFILPGGTPLAAQLHLARTVCRRAERRVTALSEHVSVDARIVKYLNRLADLLFVAARWANHRAGVTETTWPSTPGA